MSKRKKKLFARKHQPWYRKNMELAQAMEDTLLGEPLHVSAMLRDRLLNKMLLEQKLEFSKYVGEPDETTTTAEALANRGR